MLDKSLPYVSIFMRRKAGTPLADARLPEGFRFVMFQEGDETAWAEIETSVLEFEDEERALCYFQSNFLPYLPELRRRCMFIENGDGEKVATVTLWWSYSGLRRNPWLHWVAVKPECQGKGLGKALISHAMRLFLEIEGDRDIYLHTQTWSYKAINIYRLAGFDFADDTGLNGGKNSDMNEALRILNPYLRRR